MTFHVYGFRIHSFIRWCLLALLVIVVLGVALGFDFVLARNQWLL